MPQSTARNGTLLIIVAGLCAMLAALATTFLVDLRARASEPSLSVAEAQARLALYAACSFIIARDGVHLPATPIEGIYPFYPLEWDTSHQSPGYTTNTGVLGSRTPAARPVPMLSSLVTTTTSHWAPARGCPTDTWFRIRNVSTPFLVTVGIGLSRGKKIVGDAICANVANANNVANAIGVVSSQQELDDIRLAEYRETWLVTYDAGTKRITGLSRSVDP